VDVREQYLPSGYSMSSTLQAISVGASIEAGPFEPVMTYNGDIADTGTLEAWITGTVVPAASKAASGGA
jgi:hypothetical protein